MKSIDNLPKIHLDKVADVSDERMNGDGFWIYLTKEYANFEFDPQYPMRQIHEQKLSSCIARLKRGVRKITPADIKEFPHLAYQ